MINNLYLILFKIVGIMYSILRISVNGDTLNEYTPLTIELNNLQSEIRKAFYDNNKI